ncbi:MAG TPA: DNA-binding domain-containing protein [Methylocella sp.]|nr:DNA-binding domain-containing protein [Methylocella sp.]
MHTSWQSEFAHALRSPGAFVPQGVISHNSEQPFRRFAVHRNNVIVGLLGALEARFPATRKIVGPDFFKAAARLFIQAHPPRSPVMMFFGDALPAFLESFEPAKDVPYLADVARLEAARTRSYHAKDARPLTEAQLRETAPAALPELSFTLHPSLEIVESPHPIVTIWMMNSGLLEPAPIAPWRGEDALVLRPKLSVEVRILLPGGKTFLRRLARGQKLQEAADAALADDPGFDLPANLAALFTGLATGMSCEPREERKI